MDELDDDSLTAIEVQRMLLLADREAQQEHAVLRQAPQARLTEGGREGGGHARSSSASSSV